MDLRRNDVLVRFGCENGVEVVLSKCQPLDFESAQPLPDLRHVLARLYTLKAEGCADPEWKLAKELWSDWIFINLPPFNEINIKKKIEKSLRK